MKAKYILTIDQSTSASKAILFDKKGGIYARENVEHKQIYPKPGWVEHDAQEIYENVCSAISRLKKKTGFVAKDILALSISNQRETVVVWDKYTGKPVYNAIVWQCARAQDWCERFSEKGYSDLVHQKTGLILSPYFSGAKLAWLFETEPELHKRAKDGELLVGTIDSWLVWKLSGGKVHASDHSNACRTQLFNIHTLDWDDELLELFDIPRSVLPEIKSAGDIFTYTDVEGILEEEIPISGVMGDSNGALFGQNCFDKGKSKITYGTGSSVMMNIGDKPIISAHGLLTSVAWKIDDKVSYVLDGNITCTGATIKWMVDDAKWIQSADETQDIALSVKDNGGVYFIPAFSGLGAPYWNGNVRARIVGISLGSKKEHLVRAGLEAIVYQIDDVIRIMEDESGLNLDEICVDGGPTNNDFLMQFQADIVNAVVVRSKIEEFSAIGTAYMAGLSLGFWASLEEIASLRRFDRSFTSSMDECNRNKFRKGWKKAMNELLLEG